MKFLAIAFLAFIFLSSCKKNEQTDNSKYENYLLFEGGIGLSNNSTIVTSDGNLVTCGTTSSGHKFIILKTTKSGALIWRKETEEGYLSSANGIVELDGCFYICGTTSMHITIAKKDIIVTKLSSSGETIWSKAYGGNLNEYSANIIKTSDGNLLISGRSESFTETSTSDLYLSKINQDGIQIWSKTYVGGITEFPAHLIETQNGEYLVTGTVYDSGIDLNQILLFKVDSAGEKIMESRSDFTYRKIGVSTLELENEDLLICGYQKFDDEIQLLIVKTDNLGNVIWEKTFGEINLKDYGQTIKQNTDGTFTIIAASYSYEKTNFDILHLKIDNEGNQLSMKYFDASTSVSPTNLILDDNGDNIITGQLSKWIFITRTDKDGEFY